MKLRKHDVTLTGSRITTRPLTEDDWDILLSWSSDPEIMHDTDGEHEAAQARRHPDRQPDHSRPLTEDDWDILLAWSSDPEILHDTDGNDVRGYDLAQVQDVYRSDGARRGRVRRRPEPCGRPRRRGVSTTRMAPNSCSNPPNSSEWRRKASRLAVGTAAINPST